MIRYIHYCCAIFSFYIKLTNDFVEILLYTLLEVTLSRINYNTHHAFLITSFNLYKKNLYILLIYNQIIIFLNLFYFILVDEAGKTLAIIIGLMAAVALIIVFLSFIRRAGNGEFHLHFYSIFLNFFFFVTFLINIYIWHYFSTNYASN